MVILKGHCKFLAMVNYIPFIFLVCRVHFSSCGFPNSSMKKQEKAALRESVHKSILYCVVGVWCIKVFLIIIIMYLYRPNLSHALWSYVRVVQPPLEYLVWQCCSGQLVVMLLFSQWNAIWSYSMVGQCSYRGKGILNFDSGIFLPGAVPLLSFHFPHLYNGWGWCVGFIPN